MPRDIRNPLEGARDPVIPPVVRNTGGQPNTNVREPRPQGGSTRQGANIALGNSFAPLNINQASNLFPFMFNRPGMSDAQKQLILNQINQDRAKKLAAATDQQNINDLLSNFANSQLDQSAVTQDINILNQALSGETQKARQALAQQQAINTGGRLGSSLRGQADISGQAALAQQQGVSSAIREERNRQLQKQMAALQSYIQKYGIDKTSEAAMAQIQLQREQLDAQGNSDLIGGALGLVGNVAGSDQFLNMLFKK